MQLKPVPLLFTCMHDARKTVARITARETFMQFLPAIRDRCDVVINVSTGGGLGMSYR